MSRILIIYGTTDGHTRNIAYGLSAAVHDCGCEAVVVEAKTADLHADPARYDGIIVAASIHIGAFQRPVRRWVRRHAAELNRKPTMFIAVCLGILEERPEAKQEVLAIIQRFLGRVGWQPTIAAPVAGALPWTRYGTIKRWVMKRKVAPISNDLDTTRDYVYTDWDALRRIGQRFAAVSGLKQEVPAELERV